MAVTDVAFKRGNPSYRLQAGKIRIACRTLLSGAVRRRPTREPASPPDLTPTFAGAEK
jgi:hypothetical protein